MSIKSNVAIGALAAVITLGATLAGGGTAAAQSQYRGTVDAQQACTPDVFRLCNSFIPDEAKISACLRSNRRSLSPACASVFSTPKVRTVKKVTKKRVVKRR